jgi:hypothetical protein
LLSWPIRGHQASGEANLASKAIDLTLDELIAMRDRRSSFGKSQRIEGFRFGDLMSRRRGAGLELDSLGPYQWGDDIRHIDWFATARIGRPQVRQFRRDVQRTIILALDLRPSMFFGSTRQLMAKTACLAAARIAWSTSKDHQPLGLFLIKAQSTELVPPRRGRRARLQHLARIVDAYRQAIDLEDPSSLMLSESLETLPAYMSGDVEAVIVSDFSHLGDGFDKRLHEIGDRGEQSAVVIEDSLMSAPPPQGSYPIRAGDDQRLATVAIRNRDTNLYIKEADHHRRLLTARLFGLGMRQVLIADPASIDEGFFR